VLTLLEMTLIDDERYEILLARDGEEALAICEQETPTPASLDVQMPKISGSLPPPSRAAQDLGHDRDNAHGTGPRHRHRPGPWTLEPTST